MDTNIYGARVTRGTWKTTYDIGKKALRGIIVMGICKLSIHKYTG